MNESEPKNNEKEQEERSKLDVRGKRKRKKEERKRERKKGERKRERKKGERMETEEVVIVSSVAPPVHSLFVERQMITMVRKVKGEEKIEQEETGKERNGKIKGGKKKRFIHCISPSPRLLF